ncbi:MAG: exodeoxyribonuclease VII small subunit [Deltaproteobacteria bacterium]|nr:exodeoxyribonuclease VII small subunit [Deltaproteobacteria bacterium]
MVKKNFEDAMKRLEEIVKDLESGDLSLEASLKSFEEGMNLVTFCSEKLEEAQRKVTLLVKESDGKYVHQPFELKEEEETS